MTTTPPKLTDEQLEQLLHDNAVLFYCEREDVYDIARAIESTRDAAWVEALSKAMPKDEAYGMVDRFLRNNLDDSDYAEYSRALDALSDAPPAPGEQE